MIEYPMQLCLIALLFSATIDVTVTMEQGDPQLNIRPYSEYNESTRDEYLGHLFVWIRKKTPRDDWITDCEHRSNETSSVLKQMFESTLNTTMSLMGFQNAVCLHSFMRKQFPVAIIRLDFHADCYIQFTKGAGKKLQKYLTHFIRPKLRREGYASGILYVQHPTRLGYTRFVLESGIMLNGKLIDWDFKYVKNKLQNPVQMLRKLIVKATRQWNVTKFDRIQLAYLYPAAKKARAQFVLEASNNELPRDRDLRTLAEELRVYLAHHSPLKGISMADANVTPHRGTWEPITYPSDSIESDQLVEITMWMHSTVANNVWIPNCNDQSDEASSTLQYVFDGTLCETKLSNSIRKVDCSYNGMDGKFPAALVRLYLDAKQYKRFGKPSDARRDKMKFFHFIEPKLMEQNFSVSVLYVRFPTPFTQPQILLDASFDNGDELLQWDIRYLNETDRITRNLRDTAEKHLVAATTNVPALKYVNIEFAYFYPLYDDVRVRFYLDTYFGDSASIRQLLIERLREKSNCCEQFLSEFRTQAYEGTGYLSP